MDNLELLRTFVRVVETGSFTVVAREMNASLSTVSRQVAQLEEHFGVRLLHRTTRHLSLTDDGQDLRDHARMVLEAVEGLKVAVGRHKSSPTGHVRVGIPVSLGHSLVGRLPVLMARYPGLSVEFVVDDDPGDMIEDRLDLAVRDGEVANPSLIRRALREAVRIAVAAPAYIDRVGLPQSPGDLNRHDCIMHRTAGGRPEWRLTGPSGPVVISVGGMVSSNNLEVTRTAAVRGLGVALLPEYLVVDELRDHTLRRVLPDYTSEDLPAFVVYLSRRFMAPRARVVFDFLMEEVDRIRGRRADAAPFSSAASDRSARCETVARDGAIVLAAA